MSLQNEQAEFIEALLTYEADICPFSPAENITIYQKNVRHNLTESLKNTYPLLLKLLGEDFFTAAASEYIDQYPSRSYNLHNYGEYFGQFLNQLPTATQLIYLREVAEFEWACHRIYLAADHPPFAANSLEKFTPEQHGQLQFILHPASWLKKFRYPILDIVDLCKSNKETNVDIHKGGINLLIIRRELDLSLISLKEADYLFLQAINEMCPLVEALSIAQSVEPAYNLKEKLPKFIQNKIIVDCYLSHDA